MSDNREAIKQLATEFFYWWYNQSGANTLSGFDDFAETEKGRELMAALAQQGEQEPAMTLEVKKNSLYGKQYAILRPDLSLPVGLYPMFTSPQPAIPEWVNKVAAIASSYSRSIDAVEEDGGENAEDPIEQIHYLCYYGLAAAPQTPNT